MKLIKLFFFITSIFLFLSHIAIAQHNTPYSRFGLGTDLSTDFGVSKGMGGLGSSFKHPFNINFTNPASYSKLKLTALETGVYLNHANLVQPNDSTNTSGDASMDYLAFGFPITDFWGSSVGLIPYSKVSYDFRKTVNHPEVGQYEKLYNGSGQLYQFYWGNGFNYKNLSVGFNVAFLFGNIEHTQAQLFPDSTQRFNTRQSNDIQYKDIIWNLGAQYILSLNNERSITFGIHGKPSYKLYSERKEVWERFRFTNEQLTIVDTALSSKSSGHNTRLPLEVGGGAMLQKKNNWRAGFDIQYTTWSQFASQFFDEPFKDNLRIAAGGQITPDPEAMDNYVKRMQFRAGGYYNTGRLAFDGARVAQYGVTFGISLPILKRASKVTIGGDIGTARAANTELLNENYYKFHLSFTLNDKWFTQRKIK